MAFLDPSRPISTCAEDTCEGCPVRSALHCHFTLRDLLGFLLISLPGFVLGGIGIGLVQPLWLVPWIGWALAFFGLVEIRVMCSHCPHYAERGRTLSCWANHGSPKLWTYRPGPMSGAEKLVFWIGLIPIWAFPALFLALSGSWALLAAFLAASAGFFVVLRWRNCSQCMNFACPLNRVGEEMKNAFLARNPVVAQAWGKPPVEEA